MKNQAFAKLRQLAKALTPEDLRALAIRCNMERAPSRQLPGLVDLLVTDHHAALLGMIRTRVDEGEEAARQATIIANPAK